MREGEAVGRRGAKEERSSSVSRSSGEADSSDGDKPAVSESEHAVGVDGNASQDDGRSVEVEDSFTTKYRMEEQKAWAT